MVRLLTFTKKVKLLLLVEIRKLNENLTYSKPNPQLRKTEYSKLARCLMA